MKARFPVMAGLAAAFIAGGASAENLNFTYTNPNFGGDPFIASFLFGVAEAQRSATADLPPGTDGQQPGIGGGNVGGPTIVIPITPGNPTPPVVDTGGTPTPPTTTTRTEAHVRQVSP